MFTRRDFGSVTWVYRLAMPGVDVPRLASARADMLCIINEFGRHRDSYRKLDQVT